jgi:tetratricopeptide (TPR) repeat protein
MNSKIIFTAALGALLITAGFRYSKESRPPRLQQVSRDAVLKNKFIMQCSPDWSQMDAGSLANGIGVLPGWGNYRWNISTKNDSAQFYFNQGINMYYAFHIIESMASFKKAQRFDGNNAMIYWAQALAYGPNINDFAYAYTPDAFAAAQKAVSLKNNCNLKEKALINAMAVRYTADSTISRESLNQLYTDRMKKAYSQFKQDADVATLYADAMMLQHPWDYWKHNGKAEPWTPAILTVLEKTLATHPVHPGANHYYIHSVEASPNPGRALPSADRLGKLMPSVSHMIHMPSHIYIRTGNYKQGIKVNEMSVTGYNSYFSLFPEVQNNLPLYLFHNLHMRSACAMMRANYAFSKKSADECMHSFDTSLMSMPPPFGNYIQYIYMTSMFNDVRFGKWDAVLNTAPVKQYHIYATVLWHWSRGIAFAGKNNISSAKEELEIMEEKMNTPDMQVVMQPFNSPNAAAKVAEKILAGVIAEKENDVNKAIKLLTEASANEDALIYMEPRDWLLPAREYLGNVLLKAGKIESAELIFKEDLKENPNNHWSLYGLYQSLKKQKKNSAAIAVKKQFDKAFEGNDIADGHIVF